ncbi:RNA polymerase sigma factor [[Clostridium] hylemonae]|nr:sigma-70 family RNA polymerase sigma factor [[Clostridium] hylemonae]QEK16405.1 RNA polymerase sigma factor YlaC [[Clostridium] hylemonae DSM 15053]BDF03918.1 RNA polymerase subunit sigma [[Clostridium] hylemonae]
METVEEIYQNYSQRVYVFLLSKTNSHELAEELTQETFFYAVNAIDKFKGNSSVLTWLCGIAKNLWLKYLRDNKLNADILDFENVSQTISAEDEVFIQWENTEVLKLIHRLDEPIREVMYLRLIGELSFYQIGEIMGKKENWARVNFYRGKKRIIEEMNKNE